MTPETLERSIKVVALLQVLQYEIDELSANGAVFRNSLKYRGKAFMEEMEHFTSDLYKAMEQNEEAQLLHQENIKEIEGLLKEYLAGKVQSYKL